jgi:hypothetical protein
MGRLYVASVLMSISRKQPAKVAETELAPITPGAWAAWARSWSEQPAATTAKPQGTPQPTSRVMRPAGSEA